MYLFNMKIIQKYTITKKRKVYTIYIIANRN